MKRIIIKPIKVILTLIAGIFLLSFSVTACNKKSSNDGSGNEPPAGYEEEENGETADWELPPRPFIIEEQENQID